MSRPTQLRLAALAAFSGLAVVLGGGISAAVASSTTPARVAEGRDFVPGELIVRFKPGSRAAARAAALSNQGVEVERELRIHGTKLVRVPPGRSVTAAGAALERHSEVLYAEPNRIYHTSATPNDPRFPELWGLSQPSDADIDAPEAWDLQTGSSSVIVAVVDSGIAYEHPDMAPNRWVNDDPPGGGDNDRNGFVDDSNGWDFVDDDSTPIDENGHGTHVAGTIGAQGNNGIGSTGVNWDVSLMPVRVADASGRLTSARIADAFTYACKNGARVVNGSFGGTGSSQPVYDAIVAPACANTLFVFAAGNDGQDNGFHAEYPCNYHLSGAANVICVAATDRNDQLAGFSNFGASTVDLAAPGVDILSTVPAEQLAPLAGTSMATPHVAGVAALLMAQSPSCSAVQLKTILNSSVDVLGSLTGKTITGGRLNARRALSSLPAVCQASPPPPPPPPVPLPPQAPAAAVRCVVPKVEGRTLPQARTLLASRRCAIGRVRRTYSARVKKGKIISQARRPGVRLPRGTRVNVLISRGRRR